ncbi:kinase-like domain-containing protein [Mycena latifolia]|nr:kinase-like domain-containing protein [Mycena latifolia]
MHGFASASPGYRAALGDHPPPVLYEDARNPIIHAATADHSPYTYYADRSDIITNLICNQLKNVYAGLTKKNSDSNSDSDIAPPRIILIVHGIWNKEQANEMYDTMYELKIKLQKNYQYVGVVAISDSKLLKHVSNDDQVIMDSVCMLFVSDAGSIIYSGKNPAPPAFYQNLFFLLVDGIHRTGGAKAEKMWNQLPELASLSEADPIGNDEDNSESTLLIFLALYKASQTRTKILELLFKIRVVSRSQITKPLLKDDAKIAGLLQRLFQRNSYEKDIQKLPREHAIAVLNLIRYTTDRGLPYKGVVQDYKEFSLGAHRLLNWLADYLRLVPEEIAVHGVVLLSEHPIKHGGFSNIYHGKYKDPEGEDVEVALKVLKIFEDQSDERRLLLHYKFTKETLVWHYLRHKNIVPFIGVDSTTFPSPARAMVSPWMPLGSVLKYMTEFSPASMYAIELLYDIIQGLKYLHSVNVVHGDLCGRNILMDQNGRARLTEFGLAAFVDLDATIKTSTRSSSARWLAPELLLSPPGVSFKRTTESDIWAFGCVCCEIWSEGDAPFTHISSDMGVVWAFSDRADTNTARPYLSRPCDKAGALMPDVLWDLVQWCCKHKPAERPTVQVLADMLSEMKQEAQSEDLIDVEVIDIPIASRSGTVRMGYPKEWGE